jgi:HK97 gp10 family phage protein
MAIKVENIRNNFKKVKDDVKTASLSAEVAATLSIYEKILGKIGQSSSTPSSPNSPPKKKSGRLYRGTVHVAKKGFEEGAFSIIGFTKPASHAHLLEFGTPTMAPRPFFMAAYQESAEEAKKAAQRAFDVQINRLSAKQTGLGISGTQEKGARYHQFTGAIDYFDIHIDFYRAGSHIGYQLTRGGSTLSSEDFVGGGLTFNDLIPDAIEEAKRIGK